MTRHLVTGGSGYFGSLLTAELRARGKSVRVFDLCDADDRPRDVEFVQGDIRDFAAVRRACCGVDIVHHNVALVPLAKDRAAFWEVNRDGTENVLRACAEQNVAKVVNTSSSAVYGVPSRNPVTEDTEPAPQEDYGKAKLAAEERCWKWVRRGLDVSIIRPRTIMGHGRLGIMQILFEWVREGRNVPVLGDGTNLYQFVFARDLARACISAAEKSGARLFNIGARDYCSMRETLEGLCVHAGTGSGVRSVPMRPAIWAMRGTSYLGLSPLGAYHALMYGRSLYFDCSRAAEELGWSSTMGNIEMFCHSYDWYLANRERVLRSVTASHHRSAVRQGVLGLFSRML